MTLAVLIVEGDQCLRESLSLWVRAEGHEARAATSLSEARASLEDFAPDLILLDLTLPDGSGMRLLRDLHPHRTEVVLLSDRGTVEAVVDALRAGVKDFLEKPLSQGRLRQTLSNLQRSNLQSCPARPTAVEEGMPGLGRLVGRSPAMEVIFGQIRRVAPTEASVLLSGETGTGKELAATTIHSLSRRAHAPFVALNCAALSPQLIESQLFGHEKGSFTGAYDRQVGVFERVDGGTLLLDEVTEMPFPLQSRLLRVLETGEVLRLGSEQPIYTDVRVISTTNRDPLRTVDEGLLREDLHYRLAAFPIVLPPLRDRSGDVELLAQHFILQLNRDAPTKKQLSATALERLVQHSWPGNVRELRNTLVRAYLLSSEVISAESILIAPPDKSLEIDTLGRDNLSLPPGISLDVARRELILETLRWTGGNRTRTARILGLDPKTLRRHLALYRSQ